MKTTTHTIKDYAGRTFTVDVTPKTAIRVRSTQTRRTFENGAWVERSVDFDKTFKVGDAAEYDSYNLHYVGTITGIGEKTVTIKDGNRVRRLSLEVFAWRNYDLDLDAIAARNSDVMMHC